jgi:hypothetical protein
MAETLGTIASIFQLVDTAVKDEDIPNPLRNELRHLPSLLRKLRTQITANPPSDLLQRMESPLANFKATMERFTDKSCPADRPLSARVYMSQFEQFKSLVDSWLLVDLGCVQILLKCRVLIAVIQRYGQAESTR